MMDVCVQGVSVVSVRCVCLSVCVAPFPGPIPSFSMLHAETLFSCGRPYIEKIGEPGDEAMWVHVRVCVVHVACHGNVWHSTLS